MESKKINQNKKVKTKLIDTHNRGIVARGEKKLLAGAGGAQVGEIG